MCLVALAWNVMPNLPLLVAANRDEFYDRGTHKLHFWDDQPNICAGRDIQAGGTWMGVSRQGRFAAVTNFREGSPRAAARSRGDLVTGFLSSTQSAQDWAHGLEPFKHDFAGFNLLFGVIGQALFFSTNRGRPPIELPNGIHAVSNGTLNDHWPKVTGLKNGLTTLLGDSDGPDDEAILALLTNKQEAADDLLPSTGIDRALERRLSARMIVSPGYGTRSSTIIRAYADGEVSILEHSYDRQGARDATQKAEFLISQPEL